MESSRQTVALTAGGRGEFLLSRRQQDTLLKQERKSSIKKPMQQNAPGMLNQE